METLDDGEARRGGAIAGDQAIGNAAGRAKPRRPKGMSG